MIFEDLKLAEFNDFYKVILGNFPSKEIKEYDYMKETFINGDFKVLTLKEDVVHLIMMWRKCFRQM